MGGELGAEGNTVFAAQDGFQFNDKVKYMRFCQSLQERGFKPAILKRTYFPDFIGLRAFFKTETSKMTIKGQDRDASIFIVTEIKQFPYEQAAAKPKAAPKGKANASAGAAAKPNGAATPTATTTTATATTTIAASAEDIATDIVTTTLRTAKSGQTISDSKKLKVEALMAVIKHKPPVPTELKKAVNETLSNEDWLLTVGQVNEVFSVDDNGRIVFA
jgi:hypothetical protein